MANRPAVILLASLVGTTIEFFDFYIYATAAVLVFPRYFFSASHRASATLASLATFAVAFIARPVGSALFGHFGDRIGRKATLVAALCTMGLSTLIIGLLPGYRQIGIAAPLLLALCRFGQGIGLGGEWGGAVLLAVENAPPARRSWYGMFPQLGAPIGFFLSGFVFFVISRTLSDADFFAYGWRLPFLSSVVLVALGLLVRTSLAETPAFQKAVERGERLEVPAREVFATHAKVLAAGVLSCTCTFVLFYLMTVFSLAWGTGPLGYSRDRFLIFQMFAVGFFAIGVPLSAWLARNRPQPVLLWVHVTIAAFGLFLAPLFAAGAAGAFWMMALGLLLMGLTYGSVGAFVAELFPAPVRYTGSSLAFSLAGILGASVAPYLATWLATRFGLPFVGYYLSASALLSIGGLLALRGK